MSRDLEDHDLGNPFADGSTNGGPEVVGSPSASDLGFDGGGELVLRNVSSGSHDYGRQNQKEQLLQELADKQFPLTETALIVKAFEKTVIGKCRASFKDGIQMQEVADGAIEPKVGITFMAGADTPQVNLMEQMGMTQAKPDQKDAVWRVNTAGALLRNFEVDRDMSVSQTDNTAAVIANARTRQTDPDLTFYERSTPTKALVGRGRADRTVTIDSDNVEIVNDLIQEKWDLESTLIEVDQSSLVELMVNYRHLIHRGGPALTFAKTIELLDTMIEDARRLCIRSPILFRTSTRRHIISSKDTRYGVDHGTMFQTLTTSSGIKNIISRSAAYFNSLSSSGNVDKSQELIRPRFLQMLVLLLSLLNDDDLGEIADFLVTTYRIRAERQHVELLILKVLPIMSINSKIYLHAMVAAFEGPFIGPIRADQALVWNTFIQRILPLNYILPGTVAQLGQPGLTWTVMWPDEGFKDSSIFNNLQYSGDTRTINDIPPIKLEFGTTSEELSVILNNGCKYIIGSKDLENIIRMTPGKYSMTEAPDGTNTGVASGRNFDLEVTDFEVTQDLYTAIHRLNAILRDLNVYIVSSQKGSGVLQRFVSVRNNNFFSGNKRDSTGSQTQHDITQPLPEIKASGRLTYHHALIHDQNLAMAYKIEGRKITRRDLVRTLALDLRKVRSTMHSVDVLMADFAAGRRTSPGPEVRQKLRLLRLSLEEIKTLVTQAEQTKGRMEGSFPQLGDEPVSKVLYPSGAERSGNSVWHEYRAGYVRSDNILWVESQRRVVQRVVWVSDEIVEVMFYGMPIKYLVSPLKAEVAEHEREDEIKVDDRVLLLGQFVVVVEPGEAAEGEVWGRGGGGGNGHGHGNGGGNGGGHGQANAGAARTAMVPESFVNWLKITSVEQVTASQRGMKRRKEVAVMRSEIR